MTRPVGRVPSFRASQRWAAHPMLTHSSMVAAFFGLKRAYWGSLRVTRKRLFTQHGLTAARFDLLYALRGFRCPLVTQTALRRQLGVSAPVVSRMLKSLRDLGLVTRQRGSTDRRAWLISLTARGLFAIRRAIGRFIGSGRIARIVEHGLCPGLAAGNGRRDAAFLAMQDLEALLNNLRRGFHSLGTLYYPWHPDD